MVNEGRETFERGIFLLGVCVFSFIIGGIVGMNYKKRDNSTRPVEGILSPSLANEFVE